MVSPYRAWYAPGWHIGFAYMGMWSLEAAPEFLYTVHSVRLARHAPPLALFFSQFSVVGFLLVSGPFFCLFICFIFSFFYFIGFTLFFALRLLFFWNVKILKKFGSKKIFGFRNFSYFRIVHILNLLIF
jgi:hypothetical protein